MSDEEQIVKKKKKYSQHKNHVAGVCEDFELLIQNFADSGTVRYDNFALVWRTMKMSLIQSGRQTQQETREFLEDVFSIAVTYYLPPHNFQVRTGGLYIMYGLFNTQFSIPPVKFRMTLDMWKAALDYQKEAHSQQHYDIDFVFQSLKALNAFQFVSSEKELYLGPVRTKRKLLDLQVPVKTEESSKLDTIFAKDHIKQLSAVDYQYQQLKIALAGPSAKKPALSLAVIHHDMINSLNTTIQQHRDRITKIRKREEGDKRTASKRKSGSDSTDEEDHADDEDWNQGDIRAKIKRKAFSRKSSKSKKKNSPQKTHSMIPIGVVIEPEEIADECQTTTTEYISMPDMDTMDTVSPPVPDPVHEEPSASEFPPPLQSPSEQPAKTQTIKRAAKSTKSGKKRKRKK